MHSRIREKLKAILVVIYSMKRASIPKLANLGSTSKLNCGKPVFVQRMVLKKLL
jgi:hypothetical protein